MLTSRRIGPMLGAALGAAACLLASCLYSVDIQPEDGGVLGPGTLSLDSVPFAEQGVDPQATDEEIDSDTYGFGVFCSALAGCVCDGPSPSEYIECYEAVDEFSEGECLAILESDYAQCLPDAGL
jgi:hypothetical protein